MSPKGDIRNEILIGFGILDSDGLGVPFKVGNYLGMGKDHEIRV